MGLSPPYPQRATQRLREVGGDLCERDQALQRGLGKRLPLQHQILGNLERVGYSEFLERDAGGILSTLRDHVQSHQELRSEPESGRTDAGLKPALPGWVSGVRQESQLSFGF